MSRKSPVAVFLAASAILATNTIQGDLTQAGEKLGGLKEWTTDQDIDEESKLDKASDARQSSDINCDWSPSESS